MIAVRDAISVRNMGAVGDGRVDDTQAFMAAQRAAARVGGGIVFIPAGTYRIAGAPHGIVLEAPNVTFQGEGPNTSVLLNGGVPYTVQSRVAGVQNVRFAGLGFWGCGVAGVALKGGEADRVTFQNVNFFMGAGIGLIALGVQGLAFQHTVLTGPNDAGQLVTGLHLTSCSNVRIHDASFVSVLENACLLIACSDVDVANSSFIGDWWQRPAIIRARPGNLDAQGCNVSGADRFAFDALTTLRLLRADGTLHALGQLEDQRGTRINVKWWFDLTGTRITNFVDAAVVEVARHSNYLLHGDRLRDVRVTGCVFRGGWSDQCSLTGEDIVVDHNRIYDGQDMGVTVNGWRATVAYNTVVHQGAGGIYCGASDALITGNCVRRTRWVRPSTIAAGDIIVNDAERVRVFDNFVDGEGQPEAANGIVVMGRHVYIRGNVLGRHRDAGVLIVQGGSTSPDSTTILENNQTWTEQQPLLMVSVK